MTPKPPTHDGQRANAPEAEATHVRCDDQLGIIFSTGDALPWPKYAPESDWKFMQAALNQHRALLAENGRLRAALNATINAGDTIAAHFNPGPIPAAEPTQADWDFGNWEYHRNQAQAILKP